jgi:hypothetical protein
MDISEYRTQFASFNSSLELARYQNHVGLKPEVTVAQVYAEYSDLFSATAIDDLKARIEQTSIDRETERSGLHKLLNAALSHFLEAQAAHIHRELARCEQASPVQWKAETISLHGVPARLATEANKTSRDELTSRWLDAMPNCNDLRAQELDSMNASACSLGFESYRRFSLETTDSSSVRERATGALLEQTESAYKNALADLAAREFTHLQPGQLSFADLLFLERIPWADQLLGLLGFSEIHAKIFTGLGIRLDEKRKFQVDVEPRHARDPAAGCFAVSPPHDVRVAAPARRTAGAFLSSLECVGEALYYVWSSADRARRHPEFVFSPDMSTRKSYRYLFRYFAADPKWTLEFIPGLNADQATEIARAVALSLAIKIRGLGYDSSCLDDWYVDTQESERQLTYADLHQRATSFRSRGELCLIDLNIRQEPLVEFRALAFAFVLREYLRVRYGYRWWNERRAGDELIDFWDTASRYSVEELTSQVGFGELNFDILVEAVNEALRRV